MITYRPLCAEDIPQVKHIIHTVAYGIFGFDGSLEDSIRYYSGLGIFSDLDDFQSHYFDNAGTFLVSLDDGQVIGSGAIRRLDGETAELKRMWLLEAYQGRGVGYRLIGELFAFARLRGYRRVRLQTSPEQTRALAFYRKVGFHEIPCYNDDITEVSMEISLTQSPPPTSPFR
ncbi:MAG: GNAT family N-acetyltransferase [Chloroflexota bacterium]